MPRTQLLSYRAFDNSSNWDCEEASSRSSSQQSSKSFVSNAEGSGDSWSGILHENIFSNQSM